MGARVQGVHVVCSIPGSSRKSVWSTALDISNRPEPSLTSLRTSTEHGGGLRRMDDKGVGVVQDDMSGGQLIASGVVV
jgi:hypothetical protein